jgi:thiol:disulfide interchange protein DsbD
MVADPTTWSYEVQKVSAQEYKLIFHVSLKEGWHIFSQTPGDEFLIPPSFTFKKDSKIKLIGKVSEQGKLKTEKMEGIDNPINYYEGKAAFVQKIQTSGKGKVTGELEYQVCNNSMCLPPKTKNFEFQIKD